MSKKGSVKTPNINAPDGIWFLDAVTLLGERLYDNTGKNNEEQFVKCVDYIKDWVLLEKVKAFAIGSGDKYETDNILSVFRDKKISRELRIGQIPMHKDAFPGMSFRLQSGWVFLKRKQFMVCLGIAKSVHNSDQKTSDEIACEEWFLELMERYEIQPKSSTKLYKIIKRQIPNLSKKAFLRVSVVK